MSRVPALARILIAVLVVASLAACTEGTSVVGDTSPPPPALVSPSESGPQVADMHKEWTWSVLADALPQSLNVVVAYDGRYLASNTSGSPDALKAMDTRTGDVTATHRVQTPGSLWHLSDVYLAPPWMVVVEAPYDGKHGNLPAIHAFRYDLRNGNGVDLWKTPLPRPAEPEPTTADEQTFVYTTRQHGRSCLAIVRLDDLTVSNGPCAPADWLSDFPELDNGWLGFMTVATPATKKRCAFGLRSVEQLSGIAKRVPEVESCTNYGVAAFAWGAVWNEVPIGSQDLDSSAVWGVDSEGTVLSLGTGTTRTIRACNDWAYWTDMIDDDHVVIRRWKPGQDIQEIYRNPDPGWVVTSAISCSGTWITFLRAWTGGGRERGQQVVTAEIPD